MNSLYKRLSRLKESNRLMQIEDESGEINNNGDGDGKIPTSDIGRLAYSEGTKLAIGLKRGGWTLNNLPRLVDKIKAVVATELGSDNPDKIFEVATSRNLPPYQRTGVHESEQSIYTRIIRKIKKLRVN